MSLRVLQSLISTSTPVSVAGIEVLGQLQPQDVITNLVFVARERGERMNVVERWLRKRRHTTCSKNRQTDARELNSGRFRAQTATSRAQSNFKMKTRDTNESKTAGNVQK